MAGSDRLLCFSKFRYFVFIKKTNAKFAKRVFKITPDF